MTVYKIKTFLLSGLLLGFSLTSATITMAEEPSSFDIAEFHQVLDAVNNSNIPDAVKQRLLRDMRTTLIESIRAADIPEDAKRTLVRDLENPALD